eukprot:4278686-Pleurochrysis_carterae.AAC.4
MAHGYGRHLYTLSAHVGGTCRDDDENIAKLDFECSPIASTTPYVNAVDWIGLVTISYAAMAKYRSLEILRYARSESFNRVDRHALKTPQVSTGSSLPPIST